MLVLMVGGAFCCWTQHPVQRGSSRTCRTSSSPLQTLCRNVCSLLLIFYPGGFRTSSPLTTWFSCPERQKDHGDLLQKTESWAQLSWPETVTEYSYNDQHLRNREGVPPLSQGRSFPTSFYTFIRVIMFRHVLVPLHHPAGEKRPTQPCQGVLR